MLPLIGRPLEVHVLGQYDALVHSGTPVTPRLLRVVAAAASTSNHSSSIRIADAVTGTARGPCLRARARA
eukprot:COSAG02_NODE_168_length_31711_cov_68.337973_3_plen_70_part_00